MKNMCFPYSASVMRYTVNQEMRALRQYHVNQQVCALRQYHVNQEMRALRQDLQSMGRRILSLVEWFW